MTDQEIEQERKRLEPPLEHLYVDSKAEERSAALFRALVDNGAAEPFPGFTVEETLALVPYSGDGSIARPFQTLEEARAAQKPGQSIVIAGYATIGAAKPPSIPDNIKERCS